MQAERGYFTNRELERMVRAHEAQAAATGEDVRAGRVEPPPAPAPAVPQISHYDGCWREHHACAVAMIERGQAGGVPPHLNAVFDFMEGRLDAPALEDALDAAVGEQDAEDEAWLEAEAVRWEHFAAGCEDGSAVEGGHPGDASLERAYAARYRRTLARLRAGRDATPGEAS